MKADLVVHTTTEAGFKTGGVGATLFGLLSLPRYHEDAGRTVLLGPFSRGNRAEFGRVRDNVTIRHLAAEGVHDLPDEIREKFRAIEARYRVEILYGTRKFRDRTVEVLLVDGGAALPERLNEFKHRVYEITGLSSYRYEEIEGFDACMAIAVPGLRAVYALTDLKALGGRIMLAHDIPSTPFLYASIALNLGFTNVFALHEVSCARHYVEWHPGADLAFYNVMERCLADRRAARYPAFPECLPCHKGAMLGTLGHADRLLAIGSSLEDELTFVTRARPAVKCRAVHRGIPCYDFPFDRKVEARRRISSWVASTLGFLPDWIFTRVSRLVPSKMPERDLAVLERLDPLLAAEGRRAVHICLGSAVPEGRLPEDVREMERTYGWPAHHRRGFPDLIGQEADLSAAIAAFNGRTKAVRAILVNQFGFSRDKCGDGLPEGTGFEDLRLAADAEFGLSAYEPFGVSPLEPLTAGAVCVLSARSGAAGLVRDRLGAAPSPHVILADYAAAGAPLANEELLALTAARRLELEAPVADLTARRLHAALARGDAELAARFEAGRAIAGKLSWPVVYDGFYRPALFG